MPMLHGELLRLKTLARPFVVRRYFRNTSVKKLHIGCGKNVHPGWLNADKFNGLADIYLNAYDRFPFPDCSFDLIYCEHMIEHVRIGRVKKFLTETYRVLKPGGIFRVTTPDFEIYATNYVNNATEFFKYVLDDMQNYRSRTKPDMWVVRTRGGAVLTRAVHNFFHHRWFYDFETLEACLKEVGFNQVLKQGFARSLSAEAALLDQESRAFETLYVDAVK